MIRGYLNNQYPHESLSLFVKMRFQEGVFVDSFSLSLVLQACGRSVDHVNGRTTHTQVLKLGFCSDLFVQTALVEMYAKCGCIDMARAIFDDMRNPDVVSCNVLLAEYVSCGEIRSARELFDNMSERDLVSWNTMIHGYAFANELQGKKSFYTTRSPLIATCSKNRQSNEALRLFQEMQLANMVPDKVTFVSVLLACGEMGALGTGKMVHEFIKSSRFKIDLKLGTALVDMYAKCGDIDNSLRVFNAMHKKDVFAWSAMIVGLANHGLGELALDHFSRMISEQITPNSITFIGALSACSHVGLVDMGIKYFNDMNDVYGINPKLEHYGCMIDILGRAGQVQEARELIRSMPFAPDAIIWRGFLGACVVYKNIELAEEATVQLLELEPHVDGNYVLLSNLYSQAMKWDKVMDVRRMMMKCSNIQKGPGSSLIEIDNSLHQFVAGDASHLESEES